MAACEAADIEYVDPYHNGQRGNHYKFTLIAKVNANEEFRQITNRTSTVYDYALGDDPESISTRHICLPIWYALEDEIVDRTIQQLSAGYGDLPKE